MALTYLLEKGVSRIILTRPAVEAGERLGFLPGDIEEKINPYLRLNGLSFPYSGTDSDALAPGIDAATRSAFEDDLAYDFGRPTDVFDSDGAVWNFAVDLAVTVSSFSAP